MALLIDGYNFYFASEVFAKSGPPTLERNRAAVLDFLANVLTAEEAKATTIVFDAAGAPPGLPRTLEHRGIKVRFAPKGQDADSVLEQLIQLDSAPRRLTVVSSDHRVQRAAKRRKATAIDSDVFRRRLVMRQREGVSQSDQGKPYDAADASETRRWLMEFGIDDEASEKPEGDSPFPPNAF
jgi:predicted RNA-binding protein with PIN domain